MTPAVITATTVPVITTRTNSCWMLLDRERSGSGIETPG